MVNYVPMLRMKRGELVALQHVRPLTKAKITPFLDVSSDRFRGTKATSKKPAVSAPDAIAEAIQKHWGSGKIFIDASKVAASAVSSHPILDIANACSASGISMVPATQLSADAAYQADISKIVSKFGQGMCLKIDLAEMAAASAWIGALPVSPSDIDLIVDLGSNVSTALSMSSAVASTFSGLSAGSKWRSVTMVGSSMPENFSGYAKGSYLINRDEATLWNSVVKSGLPYSLDYGDFATVAVTAPASGIAWGFPINARYTLEDEFLICRGVKTTGPSAVDMETQLVDHAKSIVAHPKRAPIAGCWADKQIDSIAATSSGQGNLEKWVNFGVNRHIELVRHLLP